MGAARGILITKTFHPITELAERRGRRTAGQTASDNNDLELAPIIWTNESRVIFVARPFPIERPGRSSRVEVADHNCCAGLMNPRRTAIGIETYPMNSSQAKIRPPTASFGVSF